MKTVFVTLRASLITASTLLALAYALVGLWLPALILLAAGGGWLFAIHNRLDTLSSFIFACLVVAAGLAALFGAPAPLLAAAVVTALAAWDLDHFNRRTRGVQIISDPDLLERSHMRRLLLVCAIGLASSEAALLVHVRLSFTFEFLLAALALIGLGQLAAWIHKRITAAERNPSV